MTLPKSGLYFATRVPNMNRKIRQTHTSLQFYPSHSLLPLLLCYILTPPSILSFFFPFFLFFWFSVSPSLFWNSYQNWRRNSHTLSLSFVRSLWNQISGEIGKIKMERELVELFEAAKKAADAATSGDGGSEESRCLDTLEQLKNFPVTYQLLVSTQVGKRLRPLTKHPKRKIQTVASSLIEIWKDIVIKETSKDVKNGNLESQASVKVETPKSDKVVNKTSSVKVTKTETVKVEKAGHNVTPSSGKAFKSETVTAERKVVKTENPAVAENVKVENITKEVKNPTLSNSALPKLPSMLKCNDPIRNKVRDMLLDAFSKVSSEAHEEFLGRVNACDPIRVAVSVESVLFEKWGGSTGAQKAKYRSLMFNLKDPKNPDFRRKVLLGDVKAERLVNMSTAEMASDERKEQTKKLEEKALFDCERGNEAKATTDQFKCGRCGQRKTTYYQMQTRSADEPMTTYVTCTNCNNRWKFC